MSFDVLAKKINDKSCPIAMGLDPKLEFIPQHILDKAKCEFSDLNEAAGEALWQFNKALIDVSCDLIPCIKPQMAYYEMYGFPGLAALLRTIGYARELGLYVILDCKRGDIGATSQAYANAYLGGGDIFGSFAAPFDADCITVNPYLGIDGVKPFIDACKTADKSIFVLVKTSNPSSGDFQDIIIDKGVPLYEHVAERVVQWGSDSIGESGYSRVGAVIGATYPSQLEQLRELMPNTFFLIPGYGAQGGSANDIKFAFKNGTGAVINSSRAIMCAYMKSGTPDKFDICARDEIIDMKNNILRIIT